MDVYELESEQKRRLEYLDSILNSYRSTERKANKSLGAIIIIGAIAMYFMFSYLLGGIWGYVLTIALLGIGVYCAVKLNLPLISTDKFDRRIAYQACVTMEILIEIKKGTYRQFDAHISTTGTGKHHELYKKFICLYPEYASKSLEKLSKIDVESKDIH